MEYLKQALTKMKRDSVDDAGPLKILKEISSQTTNIMLQY